MMPLVIVSNLLRGVRLLQLEHFFKVFTDALSALLTLPAWWALSGLIVWAALIAAGWCLGSVWLPPLSLYIFLIFLLWYHHRGHMLVALFRRDLIEKKLSLWPLVRRLRLTMSRLIRADAWLRTRGFHGRGLDVVLVRPTRRGFLWVKGIGSRNWMLVLMVSSY